MTDLNNLIKSFSIEEKQNFEKFLSKRNKRHSTKNIELFKLLCKEKTYSIGKLSEIIYGKEDNSAIYALRKRLFSALIDFTANSAFEQENSIDMTVAKYLLSARRFFVLKSYNAAFKVLDKAEQLAQKHQKYTLLNEIYHTKIQYAHTLPHESLEELIVKYKTNKTLNDTEDQLNIAYAEIKIALQQANQKGDVLDFENIVYAIFQKLQLEIDQNLTFKSLYQLVSIVNISAFVKKDYYRIEPFLLSTYKKVKTHQSQEFQLYYHIQIVFIISNTLFRNKKFEASLYYLDIMKELMKSNRQKYYKDFELKHGLLLGLNTHFQGFKEKSINIFESLLPRKASDKLIKDDIRLGLVMCYFHHEDYKKAKQHLHYFKHTDSWYISKNGTEWVIKRNLIEMLLYLELGDIVLFESRLLSFKRLYFDYLRKIEQERVITFIGFIEEYYKNPSQITSSQFYDKVENAFEWYAYEDIFVMSFYAWLKAKMLKQSLFKITMELIENAN